jgi:hypothetical protein
MAVARILPLIKPRWAISDRNFPRNPKHCGGIERSALDSTFSVVGVNRGGKF